MKKKGEDSYIKFTQIYSTPWSSKNHFPQYDDSQNAKIYISKLQYDPLLETPKKLKQIQNLQMDIERITNRKYAHETGPCHWSYTQNPPQPHTCKHALSTWSKGCIVGQASSVIVSFSPQTQSQVHVKTGSALCPSPQLVSIFFRVKNGFLRSKGT